jgi:DNA polymerase-3 subunit gamma/tau
LIVYQVLALKWRPQSFEELVGQEHVARTLANAIEGDRLAHAYILAGLRGTGKTTVARILAKCLNCEKGPTARPCGTCVACREIAESRAMDVLEIDAASRTKVDQTRELLEMVSYSPVRDRYKILIIDEAHMLSKASFNALLKTLEEPPPNVLFLLATTELHKVLPTIVSRCQVFEFRRVSSVELATHLRKICDDGEIEISDRSLERLARAGEGSVRDSLSLLERAIAYCGKQIQDAEVLRMLGAVRSQLLDEMVAALARRDAAGMLRVLDGLLEEGHDLLHFWSEWIAALRDLLLIDALPEQEELLARSAEEARSLREAAAGLTREDLTRAFQIVADLEPGLKSSAQPKFLFEAALIRLADLGAVRPIEELLQGLPATPPTGTEKVRSPAAKSQKKKSPGLSRNADRGTLELIEAVRSKRPMVGALLDEAAAIRWSEQALAVVYQPAGAAFKRQLEQRESLELLARCARELAGKQVEVRVESANDEPEGVARKATGTPEASAARPKASAPPRAKTSRPAAKRRQGRRNRKEGGLAAESGTLLERARENEGVRKLLDSFGAQVVEITPLELPPDAGGEVDP